MWLSLCEHLGSCVENLYTIKTFESFMSYQKDYLLTVITRQILYRKTTTDVYVYHSTHQITVMLCTSFLPFMQVHFVNFLLCNVSISTIILLVNSISAFWKMYLISFYAELNIRMAWKLSITAMDIKQLSHKWRAPLFW